MKIFLLVIIFSISLLSRENPFEPTKTYLELKNRSTKIVEKTVKNDTNNTKEIITNKVIKKTDPATKISHIKKEEIKKHKVTKQKCKSKYSYTPLPFIKILLDKNSLDIEVDKKYKLINSDISDDGKKFIYDFKGRKTFYTIRKKLCSKYFDSFVIGTHLKEKYFRIVIKIKQDIKDYKEIKKTKHLMIKKN